MLHQGLILHWPQKYWLDGLKIVNSFKIFNVFRSSFPPFSWRKEQVDLFLIITPYKVKQKQRPATKNTVYKPSCFLLVLNDIPTARINSKKVLRRVSQVSPGAKSFISPTFFSYMFSCLFDSLFVHSNSMFLFYKMQTIILLPVSILTSLWVNSCNGDLCVD